MSKFITGKEVLSDSYLNIRDFELFYDYVKKGLLQPYSQGKSIPSPDLREMKLRLRRLHERAQGVDWRLGRYGADP